MGSFIKSKIVLEIEQIDRHINESKHIIAYCINNEPNYIEKSGLAMILHSFYHGVELVLLMIIKDKDTYKLEEHRWHKFIYNKAFEDTETRTQILRDELKEILKNLMNFRHLARNSYAYNYDWNKMKNLVLQLESTWDIVKQDLNNFLEVHYE